jgi:tetratricopeptide (TPR) repeat protein
MKTKWTYVAMATVLFLLGAVTAWTQATAARVEGTITNAGKPLADAQVVFTNKDNGKTFKYKTDKNGQYVGYGMPFGQYDQEIISATGDKLYKKPVNIVSENGTTLNRLSVDVSSGGSGQPAISKEEMEKLKAEHDKGVSMNALINQYNTAQQAKNWQGAADILKQMIAAEPNRWDYQQALGNMQFNMGNYEEAAATYEKVIPMAENASKTDPKNDPAKTKAAISQMLDSEASSYVKLKKTDKAVEAYTKAAELSPNPATAYWNLCATEYNVGDMKGAAAACDKAIAADPNKADAYFIKGSVLIGLSEGKLDSNGHYIALPGTKEAFNKYLELAPDGPHAGEVKQMMEMLGAKIETTYKDKKKK